MSSMSTQVAPSKQELAALLGQGLTQKQIVDEWEAKSGHRVARSTIAMAIERYGLKSSNPRPRYEDTLPWEVHIEHAHHTDARMLRLEGRRRRRGKLTEKEKRLLTNWTKLLHESNAVVHYDPLTEKGWWWVPREPEDGGDIIRRPEAHKQIKARERH